MKKYKEPLSITHPELTAQWHPTKNGDLTPNDVTAGSDKKVWWLFPYDDPVTGKHFDFEWQTRIRHRAKAIGCPYLSGQAVYKGFNDIATTHPELAAEWHPTKNGGLTPNDVTAGSDKKVWWFLPYDDSKTSKHFDFEWQATIADRVKSGGCPYLSGKIILKGFNDLATTHPELAAEWHPTKNSSLTPNDVTAGSGKKIWWFLPYNDTATGKHFNFEWQATIASRVNGKGCPYFSGQKVWVGFNDFASAFPELAQQWHPTKNGDLTPYNVTAGSNKKVWWLFPYDDPITGEHFNFEWQAPICSRKAGGDCPFLSGHAVWKGFNDLATTHPELVAEWHPTKNGDLTPYNINIPKAIRKIWWYLPYDDPVTGKHFDFEWEDTLSHRLAGRGCPFLSGQKVWVGFNDLATTHPHLVVEWHPTKNGSLKPENVTTCSGQKVWWLFPYDDPVTGKHFDFEWQNTISHRTTRGQGCPYLSGRAAWKSFNDLVTTHPELAKEWHPTKNGDLTPDDVAAGSSQKIWWKCSVCGYEWIAIIISRKRGRGCPLCSSSQEEKEIYNLLKSHSINFVKEHSFPDCKYKNTLRFDFAILDKDNNLIFLIEYDGIQHNSEDKNYFHKHTLFEESQKRDAIKNQYCKDNNVPLLRISYEDADRVEEIVLAELKKYSLI